MVIATYKRDKLLPPLIEHLTTTPPPSLRQILFLWQNVGAPLPDFLESTALERYSSSGVAVTVRISKKNSMNERFRPVLDWGERIKTRAVMIMDDDVVLRKDALEWGYQEWRRANDDGRGGAESGRIVGFTGRDVREKRGKWEYVVQPQETYSMVLSNAAWFKRDWLEKYWADTEQMSKLRDYVDEGESRRWLEYSLCVLLIPPTSLTVFNCDDLLVNYLVSNLTHTAPLLLQPKTPLRTVPSKGLWDRNVETSSPDTPVQDPDKTSPPSGSTSDDTSTPEQPDHFGTRELCLRQYFEVFAPFAPKDTSLKLKLTYPLVRTSSSASQDVVDHARWLKPGEAWEDGVWEAMATPDDAEEERREREEFEAMIDGMDDDQVIELMKQLEALEEDEEYHEGGFGEEEDFDDEGEGVEDDVLEHDEL